MWKYGILLLSGTSILANKAGSTNEVPKGKATKEPEVVATTKAWTTKAPEVIATTKMSTTKQPEVVATSKVSTTKQPETTKLSTTKQPEATTHRPTWALEVTTTATTTTKATESASTTEVHMQTTKEPELMATSRPWESGQMWTSGASQQKEGVRGSWSQRTEGGEGGWQSWGGGHARKQRQEYGQGTGLEGRYIMQNDRNDGSDQSDSRDYEDGRDYSSWGKATWGAESHSTDKPTWSTNRPTWAPEVAPILSPSATPSPGPGQPRLSGPAEWLVRDDGFLLQEESSLAQQWSTAKQCEDFFPDLPRLQEPPFVSTWLVSRPGKEIHLPLFGEKASAGLYDFCVDWGDGSLVERCGQTFPPTCSHKYSNKGEYVIAIHGLIQGFSFGLSAQNPEALIDVRQWGTLQLGGDSVFSGGYFDGCVNLEGFSARDRPDLSNAIYMVRAFANCVNFNGDLSHWDMSNVLEMDLMFSNATRFNTDISGWDVSKVRWMNEMFADALAYNQPLNTWDVSSVKEMGYMFWNAYSFSQPLDQWDTSGVFWMGSMFDGALHFEGGLSGWNVTNVDLCDHFCPNCNPEQLPKFTKCDPREVTVPFAGIATIGE
eukprot:g81426.t1